MTDHFAEFAGTNYPTDKWLVLPPIEHEYKWAVNDDPPADWIKIRDAWNAKTHVRLIDGYSMIQEIECIYRGDGWERMRVKLSPLVPPNFPK